MKWPIVSLDVMYGVEYGHLKANVILTILSFQVTKIQRDRQLSPEMLNSATMLLRMRDAVARLMEKCEKITKKMASLVQDVELEKSDGSKVPGSSLAGVPLVAYYFSAHWFSFVE